MDNINFFEFPSHFHLYFLSLFFLISLLVLLNFPSNFSLSFRLLVIIIVLFSFLGSKAMGMLQYHVMLCWSVPCGSNVKTVKTPAPDCLVFPSLMV